MKISNKNLAANIFKGGRVTGGWGRDIAGISCT